MKVYNKLVRDKIPEIIAGDNGKTCVTRIMEDDEYLETLNKKLQEELKEYLESGEVEELADLEEVLRAILDVKKVSYEEFADLFLPDRRSYRYPVSSALTLLLHQLKTNPSPEAATSLFLFPQETKYGPCSAFQNLLPFWQAAYWWKYRY